MQDRAASQSWEMVTFIAGLVLIHKLLKGDFKKIDKNFLCPNLLCIQYG